MDTIDTAIAQYRSDGATILRGAIPSLWIERMRPAIDTALRSHHGVTHVPSATGSFTNAFFQWLDHPVFAAFLKDSPLPEIAARFLASGEVHFFYDQLLVKEANTPESTPWHQDLPYWPVAGGELVSIWVPFDRATRETGSLYYVKGSHLWGKDDLTAEMIGQRFADLPEPGVPNERFTYLNWDLEPGDILLHHPRMVHGAPGNTTLSARRRAIATRWATPDVTFAPTARSFFDFLGDDLPKHGLKAGDRLDGPVFPKVWPRAA